jgi:putative peptidoglycan lipid II flippase
MTVNRKILKAVIILGTFTFLAKLGSAGKDVVVAQWFGRGDAVDAFLMALLIQTALINLSADALSVALIPVYISVREKEGSEAGARLLSSAFVLGLGLLTGLCALLGLLAPYYLPIMASGFDSAKLTLTLNLVYCLLPLSLMSGMAVLFNYVLNAHEQFALPAWAPIWVPLGAVLFLLMGGKTWGIYALAAGSVFGAFVQCTALARGLWVRNIKVFPRWHGADPSLRKVMRQFLPTLPTGFLILGMGLVDQAIAAMMEPGSVAALGYGVKVVALVNGMGSAALSFAIFPYFSSMAAQNDRAGLSKTLNTYVLLCLWTSAVLTSFIFLFSHPLTALIFERGAFTPADTVIVARVLAFYSLEIPSYVISILAIRMLSCLSLNQAVAVVALMNFVVNAVMDVIFVKHFGVAGIALSSAVVYALSCLAVFVALFKRVGISLDRKAVIHVCTAGMLLLWTVAVGVWSKGRLGFSLVGWSVVLVVAVWGISRRFSYKQIIATILGGRAA